MAVTNCHHPARDGEGQAYRWRWVHAQNFAEQVLVAPMAPPCATTSIGIAAYPRHASDAHDLFLMADNMMYKAKRKERNCIAPPDDDEVAAIFARWARRTRWCSARWRRSASCPSSSPSPMRAPGGGHPRAAHASRWVIAVPAGSSSTSPRASASSTRWTISSSRRPSPRCRNRATRGCCSSICHPNH
ncbi:diguanylate cyclase [Billgrantia gudaonensis]|uniref:Diguanylate cyclase n=1 Tax=Billgrantia gudaonensis TaxID=376427 RepID=A0A3S0Q0Q3_9GAMM|nr:diguanylate cyclase [Halomonas gudaonensis]